MLASISRILSLEKQNSDLSIDFVFPLGQKNGVDLFIYFLNGKVNNNLGKTHNKKGRVSKRVINLYHCLEC